MDEHKMPEPVAWRCNWNRIGKTAWVQYHDEIDPLPETWAARPNETLPLYSAETVQALQAEVERLRGEVEALRYDAGTSASVAGTLMAENAALRAERDALTKDAAQAVDLGPVREVLRRWHANELNSTDAMLALAEAMAVLDSQKENARLIAAAPALLDALRDALIVMEASAEVMYGKGWTAVKNSPVAKARAAIAKATGEQP